MALRSTSELQPLLDTQQNQLALIFDASDSIDNKALALLATNVTLLIFIAQSVFNLTEWWHYTLVVLPYSLSLLLDIVAMWPRKYVGASIDLNEHPEYLTYDQERLILQLVSDTNDAIHVNFRLNVMRWRFCVASLGLAALGTLALIVIL